MQYRHIKPCIYCGSVGKMSDEHFWGKWSKILDRPLINRTLFKNPHYGKLVRKHISGDPRSRQLDIVCEKCNNEWLSDIQNRAKPLLLELYSGYWPEMNAENIETLLTWATMMFIHYEYTDPKTILLTDDQRHHFYETKTPPDNFHIYMGIMEPGELYDFAHNHIQASGGLSYQASVLVNYKLVVCRVSSPHGFPDELKQLFLEGPICFGMSPLNNEFNYPDRFVTMNYLTELLTGFTLGQGSVLAFPSTKA